MRYTDEALPTHQSNPTWQLISRPGVRCGVSWVFRSGTSYGFNRSELKRAERTNELGWLGVCKKPVRCGLVRGLGRPTETVRFSPSTEGSPYEATIRSSKRKFTSMQLAGKAASSQRLDRIMYAGWCGWGCNIQAVRGGLDYPKRKTVWPGLGD